MANMNDYLLWRGDLTFVQSGVNEVDAALLTFLSFINFRGIVQNEVLPDHGIALADAVDLFFQKRDDIKKSYCTIISGADIRQTVTLMAKSRRFRDAKLYGYVNQLNYDRQEQFSAYTAVLNDGTVFVVFKGTDDTLVGWKEDLNMAFSDEVPCQKSAVGYLNQVGQAFPTATVRIGGHSKGGNLAVYAAARCGSDIRDRISRVYNNDGPGFSAGFLESEAYLAIKDRVLKLVPQESIVGMLLTNDGNFSVISSEGSGVVQHNCYLWQVRGRHFIRRSGMTRNAVEMSRTLNEWINEKDLDTRRAITDAIYDIATADNAHTLNDFNTDKLLLWRSLAKIEPAKRELVFRELIQLIRKLIRSGMFPNIKQDQKNINDKEVNQK